MAMLARILPVAALVCACSGPGIESDPRPQPAAAMAATSPDDTEELARAVARARAWLVADQAPDGTWGEARDGFSDTGLSALATLALLRASDGDVETERAVSRGARALLEAQDLDTGRIGPAVGHAFHYGHAIATLALCELRRASGDPELEVPTAAAVRYALAARNPYGAWRYDFPPNGSSDTSVTGWMLEALTAARSVGLDVDRAAFEGGLDWIDEVTEPESGRVGYDTRGSSSSRIDRVNDHISREGAEGMTAVGLASRALLGQDSEREPIMLAHAELIRANPPEWDPAGVDMYYWYHGTRAMRAMGGRWWSAWRRSVVETLLAAQEPEGPHAGSWEPNAVWSYVGGRTYTTAVALLTLAECRR